MSLLEMVVALAILAILLPMILNLLPSGLFVQRRAEDVEIAAAYASGWLEEVKDNLPARSLRDRDQQVTLGRQTYHATRDITVVGQYLYDVVVTMSPAQGQPVVLATRIFQSP